MSPRSIYLRDQAAKCEWHANNLGDSETQVRLRKLAAEYIVQANDIESKESGDPSTPPRLLRAFFKEREDFDIPGFPQAENSLGLCRDSI
jgi:hypothetical protein